MKQKYLVINCDANELEDLRRRLGYDRELVACPTLDDARRHMMTVNAGVLMSVAPSNDVAVPNGTSVGGEHHQGNNHSNPEDVDNLVARILETANGVDKTLAARVDLLEQKIIEQSLNRNGQHRKETAAELGISRVTLYNKMKKFGLLD